MVVIDIIDIHLLLPLPLLMSFPFLHVGLDSSAQEEFLSILGGARTSPPVHQFLVNSLGEVVCTVFSSIISDINDRFVVHSNFLNRVQSVCLRLFLGLAVNSNLLS